MRGAFGGASSGPSIGGEPFARRHLVEHRARLLLAPGGEQPARRLGHPHAHPQDEQGGDRGGGEQPAPAERRHEDPREPGRGERADPPEALEDHQPAAAVAARQELGEQREVQRQRAAEAEAAHRPQHGEPDGARRERRREAEDREDEDRDLEAGPAADAVGDRAPEPGADQHPEERRGDDEPRLALREVEFGHEAGQGEGDEEDLGGVGGPRHPADGEQLALEAAEPHAVDRLVERHGSRGRACHLTLLQVAVRLPLPARVPGEAGLRTDPSRGPPSASTPLGGAWAGATREPAGRSSS